MPYSKVNWTNQTPINTTNLAKMDQGIADAHDASKVLSLIKTVDGEGSGLDADLLDGKHLSSFYIYKNKLPSNANFNDYIEIGTYNFDDVGSMANATPFSWGVLEVHSASTWIVQRATEVADSANKGRTVQRVRNGGTWSEWKEVGAGVRGVQRGLSTLTVPSGGAVTVNVPISSVVMNKSQVNITSTGTTTSGTGDGRMTVGADVRARLTSPTNFELYYKGLYEGGTVDVAWEVIEHV